jgi:hypothetical protein
MIVEFNKFSGKVKTDSLDKEEVIELVSVITDLRPSLPELEKSISKLIDNITYYLSEDGKYKISVYFRESDVYQNEDGTTTYGKFKSLYKVNIVKLEGDFQIGDIKEYVTLTLSIITEVYPESKVIIKVNDERISIDDFKVLNDDDTIDNLKLVIRII